jgi:pyruvate,water dikinase
MDQHVTLWLTDERCQDPARVGNKGANLARLAAANFAVPQGFCVTVESRANPPSRTAEDDPARPVMDALRSVPGPWAVRSSATVEDGTGLAFPGVFATMLGLQTPSAVMAAINRVRASSRTRAVEQYAWRHGVDLTNIGIAVIVQTTVQPTVSGVAFSQDVVRGSRSTVIEATYGLGLSVADGTITPDSVEVTETGQVRIVRIGSKHEIAVLTINGVMRTPTDRARRDSCCLTAEMALTVAETARNIERCFGTPQDIEWAAAGDMVVVLQARPITIPARVTIGGPEVVA